jgi:hypothetical protein
MSDELDEEEIPVHQPYELNIIIQWHLPEQMFAAVLVRDGEPWYLGGALVGTASAPRSAVGDLLEQVDYLVRYGENHLTEGPISEEDRRWLFKLLDKGNDTTAMQARYVAMRDAGFDDPTS